MSRRTRWLAAALALLLLAFYFGSRALEHVLELSQEPQGPSKAEVILRDKKFFSEDFGRRAVAYLYEPKPKGAFLLERLFEPRPTIQQISARYGQPETTNVHDLTQYGVARRATVYSYGRLSLAASEGDPHGRISWVLLK